MAGPNAAKKYAVLAISGVSNVTVARGTLQGDRNKHKGKSGEWGMGIRINHGSSHITISGVTSQAMWGDGFYVDDAKDLKFCAVTADRNRRQGLSIIDADGVLVRNSVFKNTGGTRPGAGIDLEPDKAEQGIANIQIQGCKFLDNAGAGIQMSGKRGRRREDRAHGQCVQEQSHHARRECAGRSVLGDLRQSATQPSSGAVRVSAPSRTPPKWSRCKTTVTREATFASR